MHICLPAFYSTYIYDDLQIITKRQLQVPGKSSLYELHWLTFKGDEQDEHDFLRSFTVIIYYLPFEFGTRAIHRKGTLL